MDSTICRYLMRDLKSVHSFHFGNYPNYNKKYMFFEKLCCYKTDRLVAVADFQRERICEAYGLSDNRIQTIWNGVERACSNTDCPIDFNVSSGTLVIGSIGNLIEQKGYFELLQVARKCHEKGIKAKFVVVGGGPLHEKLLAKRSELQLNEYVHFTGYLEKAATRALPFFDIFFMPSKWEAMPVALLEAMSAGKPIITTNVSDNPKIISHGSNGLLVEKDDIEGMHTALESVIMNSALRAKLSKMAWNDYNARFTVFNMVRSYEELYLSMKSKGEN